MLSPGIAYSKEMQTRRTRIKPSQRQLGEIDPKARKQVKNRSQGICEVRKRCDGAFALEMAHITSRKHLTHKTTAADLLHACVECHRWLDQSIDGIKYKKTLLDNHL